MTRILIVEDEIIIGLDLAEQLAEAGFDVVGIATTAKQGLDLFDRESCDVAILDVNLGDHTSLAVAQKLAQKHVPYVVLTGYASEQAPKEFKLAPMFAKPIRMDHLIDELRKCAASLS